MILIKQNDVTKIKQHSTVYTYVSNTYNHTRRTILYLSLTLRYFNHVGTNV